jgi:hypothetical protein
VCALLALVGTAAPCASAKRLEVKTLSSRPDMVSGGCALVQVTEAGDTLSKRVSILVNGRDVTAAFRLGPRTQTLVGLVDRLRVGKIIGSYPLMATGVIKGSHIRQLAMLARLPRRVGESADGSQ